LCIGRELSVLIQPAAAQTATETTTDLVEGAIEVYLQATAKINTPCPTTHDEGAEHTVIKAACSSIQQLAPTTYEVFGT
jgi:hypothetical protein